MFGINEVNIMKDFFVQKNFREKNYEKIIKSCGATNQIVVAIEELSELQKELCKLFRNKSNRKNILEEIADCEIMLEQLKIILNIKEDLSKIKNRKIQRTLDRLKIKEK